MRSSEQSNPPTGVRSLCTTTLTTRARVDGTGVAVDADVLEALGRVTGFERGAVPGGDDHVGLERERRGSGRGERPVGDVGLGEVAVGVEPLAVGDGDLGAGRAQIVEADPAVAVLAEIDHVATGRDLGDRHGGELLDASHRRADRGAQPLEVVVGDPHPVPAAAVGAWLGPVAGEAAEVVDLPADEVGGQDVAGRGPPRPVGAEDQLPAVTEGDLELGQVGRGRAVGVECPDDAVLAPPPPVAQAGAQGVGSLHQQVRSRRRSAPGSGGGRR